MSLFDSASVVITPSAYKASKLYVIKPTDGSGDLTVVRATSATRVNSEGLIESVANNVPRLDYTNSTCPSILVEPQRTNLLERSEEFDNAYWTKVNSTITANSIVSPDGNNTADLFLDNAVNTQHRIDGRVSGTGGVIYTLSAFLKAKEYDKVALRTADGGLAYFNILNGTIIVADAGVTAKIENYGNGWFRCSASQIKTTTGTMTSRINILNASGSLNFAGTGTSGLYIWGAQLEAGANATSYIPTTSASVTRNADNIDLLNSSILPTSYPFTILTKAKYSLKNQYFVLSFLDTTSPNAYFALRFLSNKINALIRPSLTEILVTSSSNFNEGDLVNIILKVTSSQIKLFVNGQLESTVTNTLLFNTSINDLTLGRLRVVSDTNTRIGNDLVSIWNQELTDQECINLTTI